MTRIIMFASSDNVCDELQQRLKQIRYWPSIRFLPVSHRWQQVIDGPAVPESNKTCSAAQPYGALGGLPSLPSKATNLIM